MRDPSLLWQPWVGARFPGAGGPLDMINLRWSTYVAMWDSIKDGGADG